MESRDACRFQGYRGVEVIKTINLERTLRYGYSSEVKDFVFDNRRDECRALVDGLWYCWPGRVLRSAASGDAHFNLMDDKYCVDPDTRGLL